MFGIVYMNPWLKVLVSSYKRALTATANFSTFLIKLINHYNRSRRLLF